MGRGRSGHTTTSLRKVAACEKRYTQFSRRPPSTGEHIRHLTPEDIQIIKSLTKEQIAPLEPSKQIIHNWLFWFCNNLFNVVDFQRLDWVSSPSPNPFLFTRLVQISHIDLGRELFLVQTNWSRKGRGWFG